MKKNKSLLAGVALLLTLVSTGCEIPGAQGIQKVMTLGGAQSPSQRFSLLSATDDLPYGRPHSLPTSLARYPNLLLPARTFFKQVPVGSSPQKVFAHYMVALPMLGPNGGVQGAIQEILMAQSMGLDGFALNVGAWFGDPKYMTATANLFAAAQQLKTGFLLFFSADMTGVGAADVLDMMATYNRHPNYFRVEGLPVLSTYAAGSPRDTDFPHPVDWWKHRVLMPLQAQGIGVYFVPDVLANSWESPNPEGRIAEWSSIIQGGLDWTVLNVINNDAGNWVVNNTNQANSTALAAAHKTLMAAVVNQYWGSLQTSISRPYHDFKAGLGEKLQWEDIIHVSHPQWVEILTWNDKEESYMMPIDDFMKYNDWGLPKGHYKPHAAYGELERYYIQWYKTGIQPTLTKDSIFYFYRTHSVNLVASNDPKGNCYWFLPSGSGTDTIYVTVALTSPATLTVQTGGGTPGSQTHTFELPAGIQNVEVTPFVPGAQSFSLSRQGHPLNSIQGEPIVTQSELYDYWMTTGFVETAP